MVFFVLWTMNQLKKYSKILRIIIRKIAWQHKFNLRWRSYEFIGEFTCKKYVIIKGYIMKRENNFISTVQNWKHSPKKNNSLHSSWAWRALRSILTCKNKKNNFFIFSYSIIFLTCFFILDSRSFNKSGICSSADRFKRIWKFW